MSLLGRLGADDPARRRDRQRVEQQAQAQVASRRCFHRMVAPAADVLCRRAPTTRPVPLSRLARIEGHARGVAAIRKAGLRAVAYSWLCAASSSAIMAAQSAAVPTHWGWASGGSSDLLLILPMAPART